MRSDHAGCMFAQFLKRLPCCRGLPCARRTHTEHVERAHPLERRTHSEDERSELRIPVREMLRDVIEFKEFAPPEQGLIPQQGFSWHVGLFLADVNYGFPWQPSRLRHRLWFYRELSLLRVESPCHLVLPQNAICEAAAKPVRRGLTRSRNATPSARSAVINHLIFRQCHGAPRNSDQFISNSGSFTKHQPHLFQIPRRIPHPHHRLAVQLAYWKHPSI